MFKKENKKKEENIPFNLGLKRLILEIKKRKKEFIILFIVTILISLGDSMSKMFLGKTIDGIIDNNMINIISFDIGEGYYYASIFLLVLIADNLSSTFLWKYYTPMISFKVYKSYVFETFSKVLEYPVSFYKKEGLGKISYSVTNGGETISTGIDSIGSTFLIPMMIIMNLLFLFLVSTEVFLLSIIGFVIYVLIFIFSKKTLAVLEDKNNDKRKAISESIIEKLNLIFEVKKNNKEKDEIDYFYHEKLEEQNKTFYNKIIFGLKIGFSRDLIYIFTLGGSLFLSVYLYEKNYITIGEIASVNMYVMYLNWNYDWLVRTLDNMIKNLTVVGDTEKLLLHTPENYTEGKISKKVEGNIEFKNLSFNYEEDKKEKKKTFNLSNLNLKIKKGSKVAFVGESGGGKSTSIELVGGFYFPNQGELLIDNISTKDWNLNDLRSSIAYVSQDISIFNTTIGENISYGKLKEEKDEAKAQKEIEKAAKLANIHEYIENLPEKYNTKVGEKGLKLSGGQRQRIAIARAILRNPKILILDEPTSALDIESETEITESLKELMKGRTTIIIAHRISTVRDSDEIFVFKEGKIIESGSYKELESKPNGEFKRMVELSEGLG